MFLKFFNHSRPQINLVLTGGIWLMTLSLWMLLPPVGLAGSEPGVNLSTFGMGAGPSHAQGIYRLLDKKGSFGQSNAVAFDVAKEAAFAQVTLSCSLRVLAGGDGGAFTLLSTTEYGKRGPAPFVKNWAEPNLAGTFAVGIDVHDPPPDQRDDQWGNYQALPEREVSLHWDGREIVKRFVAVEFRGDFAELKICIQHVIGGAEVSVFLAGEAVFESYFIAGMLPYESRLAIGAGTRAGTTTEFDVRDIALVTTNITRPGRQPTHFQLFNHVMTNPMRTSYQKEVALPPLDWAFGRIILTLEIHDAGPDWDPWDRNGALFIIDPAGIKRDIAPFITPFRTPGYWQVDITHFRPWLTGEVWFEIATTVGHHKGRGFMLSAALDFYHGTPELIPYRVVPLWTGTARYKSAANHFSDFFTPQTVSIDPTAQAARLLITTTGHSPIGEFTPSRRTVVFTAAKDSAPAAEYRFENVLWKTDSYLNPVRPQRGTWKFARAGWAPGDVVRPWWIDLTRYIIPGKTAEISYEPAPYDFTALPEEQRPADEEINQAVQRVRAYLILYRAPGGLIPAPTIEVLEVEAGSNADIGGIKAGDYLESYDGQRFDTIEELIEMTKVAAAAGKHHIQLVVYRGNNRLVLTLGPGRMGVKIAEESPH